MLRLTDRHAIAWNDDTGCNAVTRHRNLLWVTADLCAGDRLTATATERLEQHSSQSPIHRLAHHESENQSSSTYHGAGDDENIVANHEAGESRGNP